GDDGELADFLGQLHGRGEHVLRGGFAAYDLQQSHDIRWTEEVHADHVRRSACERGDLVDVECRGVGGENGARLGDVVELAEDFLFDAEVFEHGFDDEVGGAQVGIG